MPDVAPLQDQLLDTLTWLRGEVYPGLVGHDLDDRGIAAWVCDRYIVHRQTLSHADAKHRVFAEIERVVRGDVSPVPPVLSPPDGQASRLVGQLRLHDGALVDDTGDVLPLLCHLGDGMEVWLRRPAFVVALLEQIRAAGFVGIRFWPTLEWRNHPTLGTALLGPRFQADYDDLLEEWLRLLRDVGLCAQLSPGSLLPTTIGDDADAFARRLGRVVARVGPQVIALFEGANESRDTTPGWDAARLARFVAAFKSECPSVLCALSAYTGHEDARITNDYSRPPADVAVYHQMRLGSLAAMMQHTFSYRYIGTEYPGQPSVAVDKAVLWNGEGYGPGRLVSAGEGQGWMTGQTMAAYAGIALTCHQPFVYFSGPGVRCESEDLATMPGFRTVAAVRDVLPRDIMRWQIVHGGDRWADRRIVRPRGSTRAAHALSADGRFAVWVYDGDRAVDHVRGVVDAEHDYGHARLLLGSV